MSQSETLLRDELRTMGRGGELIDEATVTDGEGNTLTLILYRLDPVEVGYVGDAKRMIETRWALSNRTSGVFLTRWEKP